MKRVYNLALAALITVMFWLGMGLLFSAAHAQASHVCGPYSTIEMRLKSVYRERTIISLFRNSDFFELWTDPDGESWTIVLRYLDEDNACVMAAGKYWEMPLPTVDGPDLPGVEH